MTSPTDPTKNYGSAVSGFLDPTGRNWETVVFQAGKPVLDVELNLQQDIDNGGDENNLRNSMPSGWIADDFVGSSNPTSGIFIPTVTSNTIQIPQGLKAFVNGWLLDVANTGLISTNQLVLPAPPGSGTRTDVVVLEVWRFLLYPSPSTAGKSPLGNIWGNGNVKNDPANDSVLNYADDILNATLGQESTKRVQVQYRLRVISGVNVFSYPYALDDTTNVFANSVPTSPSAPDGTVTSFNYVNQASNGDPGLWVAGDGNPANSLGTVDGYMYAIPLMAIFRRNSGGFIATSNQNGGINSPGEVLSGFYGVTNSSPTVTTTLDTIGTLQPGFSITFASQVGVNYTVQSLTTNSITLTGNYTGTTNPSTLATLLSDRPDGLNSDLIVPTDVADLRLGVSPFGWNYQELLEKNFTYLLDNALTTEWTNTGSFGGGQNGHTFLWADQIGPTPSDPSAPNIGNFDAVRRTFSDRPVYEVLTIPVPKPGGGWANSSGIEVNFTTLAVYPYSSFNWASFAPGSVIAIDIVGAHFIGDFDGNGSKTANVLSHLNSVTGLGTNPVSPIYFGLDALTGLGITTETLYLDILVAYPSGGLTKTATNTFGPTSFEVDNPSSLPNTSPIYFSALANTNIDSTHREVQLEYTTVSITTNVFDASTDTKGTTASISAFTTPSLTLTGLTDRTPNDVGNTITLSGAANAGNNGAFPIIQVLSPTSVVVTNASGVYPDANSGSITWQVAGTTFRLPERAQLISNVKRNGTTIAGTVVLPSYDQSGRRWQFTNSADYTSSGDTLQVTYQALRPMPQTGTSNLRMNVWYQARAPQAGRFDGYSGGSITSLSVIPRHISPSLYVITSGPASEDYGYPFPNAYVQTGGIYNTSSALPYAGEQQLNGRAAISVSDFNATTGFLKLPSFVPYMPDPELVSFMRAASADVDIEGRSFFKTVGAGYVPNAYAQNLSDPTVHKVIQPMLAELSSTSSYGHKGQLILVLLIRWAVFDAVNGVFFESLTVNTTTASMFRIKGNLLNRRNT
jgi:hypothetical protein